MQGLTLDRKKWPEFSRQIRQVVECPLRAWPAYEPVAAMNERMHRFLKGQTDSRAKRQLVHDVWLSYRRIEPDLAVVAQKAETQGLRIHLYFGAHDRVIPPGLGENLARHAPSSVSTHVLPFGHVLLTTELAEAIAADAAAGGRME